MQLERAKSYGECRNILRYVIRDRIQQGAPEPLFSIDDYMEHLFPASDTFAATPWRETRESATFSGLRKTPHLATRTRFYRF